MLAKYMDCVWGPTLWVPRCILISGAILFLWRWRWRRQRLLLVKVDCKSFDRKSSHMLTCLPLLTHRFDSLSNLNWYEGCHLLSPVKNRKPQTSMDFYSLQRRNMMKSSGTLGSSTGRRSGRIDALTLQICPPAQLLDLRHGCLLGCPGIELVRNVSAPKKPRMTRNRME